MYQPISSFPGGLDTRKMSLSLPAGTLTSCNNAHITQGAEIEKRKAFVQISIPSGTFGACSIPSGIAVFGSGSQTGVTFNSPLIYQQLIHPAVLAGVSYDASKHAMTAILHSTPYGAFAFAIAQYADGGVYCYYNGILVADFTSGVVLAYMAGNSTAVATEIASLVNATYNYSATASGAALDVFSTPGNGFGVTTTVTSASNIQISSVNSTNYPTSAVTNTTGNNSPDGTAITIGGQSYRFKSTMVAAYDVQIGVTVLATVYNLFLAINAAGSAGTNYYAGTAANPNVKATLFNNSPYPAFTVTAIALNNSGEIQNGLSGVSATDMAPTTQTTTGTFSQGQFRIVAAGGSTAATGTIVSSGTNPANGSTVTIGGKVYTFQTSLSGSYGVKIGVSAGSTLQNLIAAVNASGIAGTQYTNGVAANPNVTGSYVTGLTSTIIAILPGTSGNSIAITTSGTTNLTVSATLSGGASSGISKVTIGSLLASGTITSTGVNLTNGETITIGGTVYTFKTTLSTEGDIFIGLTAGDTLQNLIEAINQTGTNLLNYKVTSLNPQVLALATLQGGTLKVLARTAGSAGNSIAITTTSSKLTVSATLTGGADAVQLLPNGGVLCAPGATIYQFGNAVVASINGLTSTTGFYAVNKSAVIYIYSQASNSFADNAAVTVTSSGTVCIGFCGINFSLAKGTLGGYVQSISVNGFNIMTAAGVSYSTTAPNNTLAGIVASVATNINTNTANGPDGATPINQIWIAIASGTTLYLSNIATSSNDPPQTIGVTTDGTYIAYSFIGNFGLTAKVAPASIYFPIAPAGSSIGYSPVVATCQASGGYPPYSYLWQYVSGDTLFSPTDPTKQNVTFSKQWESGATSGVWACLVTDSQGNAATSGNITLYPS